LTLRQSVDRTVQRQPNGSARAVHPSLKTIITGIARGSGGALIFALPMLMTMEMWSLGFYIDRLRLALLLTLNIPLLIFLSHYAGFEETFDWREDLRDAAVAYAIGIIASAGVLTALGIIGAGTPLDEIVGKVALQSVPASIGALLARVQLGGEHSEPSGGSEPENYGSELFLMGIGALFLGLNVAPTEEMVLISYRMTEWHAMSIVLLSIVLMHGFVYALAFKGADRSLPPGTPWWDSFLRFTMVGYVIAIAISIYSLWTFGRLEGTDWAQTMMSVIVLAFPAAIGAAAARLIL